MTISEIDKGSLVKNRNLATQQAITELMDLIAKGQTLTDCGWHFLKGRYGLAVDSVEGPIKFIPSRRARQIAKNCRLDSDRFDSSQNRRVAKVVFGSNGQEKVWEIPLNRWNMIVEIGRVGLRQQKPPQATIIRDLDPNEHRDLYEFTRKQGRTVFDTSICSLGND